MEVARICQAAVLLTIFIHLIGSSSPMYCMGKPEDITSPIKSTVLNSTFKRNLSVEQIKNLTRAVKNHAISVRNTYANNCLRPQPVTVSSKLLFEVKDDYAISPPYIVLNRCDHTCCKGKPLRPVVQKEKLEFGLGKPNESYSMFVTVEIGQHMWCECEGTSNRHKIRHTEPVSNGGTDFENIRHNLAIKDCSDSQSAPSEITSEGDENTAVENENAAGDNENTAVENENTAVANEITAAENDSVVESVIPPVNENLRQSVAVCAKSNKVTVAMCICFVFCAIWNRVTVIR